jgi:hypothetical protein
MPRIGKRRRKNKGRKEEKDRGQGAREENEK